MAFLNARATFKGYAGTRFPALRIHSEVALVFPQAHSANELAAHDNGPGSENPRAVLKITDPLDSAVRPNVEPDDPLDFPRAIPYIEQNDRGLAVHLAECQPPDQFVGKPGPAD